MTAHNPAVTDHGCNSMSRQALIKTPVVACCDRKFRVIAAVIHELDQAFDEPADDLSHSIQFNHKKSAQSGRHHARVTDHI
jgi:hypothetical protein